MRIVNIVTQLENGGVQSLALQVAAGLRDRGHEAETWFLYCKHPAYENETDLLVVADQRPRSPLGLTRLVGQLSRMLGRYRADGVIGFTYYANALGLFAAARANVSVRIATHHNPAWSYPRLGRLLDRWVGATAAYGQVVAVSKAVEDTLAGHGRRYREKLLVVPNGIRPTAPSRDREETRSRFGLPSDAPIVLNVGRLVDQKNHRTLIRALARVPGAWLAVAGGGPLHGQLTRLADGLGVNHRLTLLGELPPLEIANLLHAVDLFAMPSIHEGMSLAMIEAMYAGLPIVASDIPPQVELLRPGGGVEVGLLHPPMDAEALALCINRLLDDESLRSQYRQASRDRATEFAFDRMIDRYEALLVPV